VHIDAAIFLQFVQKIYGQICVPFRRKIAQGIAQRQFFFFRRKNVLALWGVRHRGIKRLWSGQVGRDALANGRLKSVHGRKVQSLLQVMALLLGYDAPFCFVEAIGAVLAAIFAAIAALEQDIWR
jgi:hypothetical protein